MHIPRTMRALVKDAAAPGLTLTTVAVPQVGPNDVLIRVAKAGICGTDLHIYAWDDWAASRVRVGTVIGHEFMGQVAAVGSGVRNIRVGERVSGEGHIGCNHCSYCRTGQGHICAGVAIIGIDVDGCFAEYVRLPEANVWRLHPTVSDRVGAIHDPLGNAMHTVMAGPISGKSVLVVGAGAIGLLIVNIARAAGAADVVALDTNPAKLQAALSMGANLTCDPRGVDVADALRKRTRDSQGFDVMLEASGSAEGLRTGLSLLRAGGWAALLGIPHNDVHLNLARDVIFKGITLHGISGRRMYETWYQVEDFLVRGRVQPERIITHELPIAQYAEAFATLRRGEAIKVILDLDGGLG